MFKIMCDTVVNEDVQNIINVDSVDLETVSWKNDSGHWCNWTDRENVCVCIACCR